MKAFIFGNIGLVVTIAVLAVGVVAAITIAARHFHKLRDKVQSARDRA